MGTCRQIYAVLLLAGCMASCLCAAATTAEEGLVAYYTFDEGDTATAFDHSGNGNDGAIHNGRLLGTRSGHCLEFDGRTSYVDCGNGPTLDLTKQLTMAAWVYVAGRPMGEPGIMGKQFGSFLLTYYKTGYVYAYINSGGNNANTPMGMGRWHHLAMTFDGAFIRIYIDGAEAAVSESQASSINSGGSFVIGSVFGQTDADDPNYRQTSHFAGAVDEVRVYSRALGADEVLTLASAQFAHAEMMEPFEEIQTAHTLWGPDTGRAERLRVKLDSRGAARIDTGAGSYVLDSFYSYPGETIGYNKVGAGEPEGQAGWQSRLADTTPSDARIVAAGPLYRLERTVRVRDGVVEFEDTLHNTCGEPVGLIIRHHLTSRRAFEEVLSAASVENPTIFTSVQHGGLGVILEDDLSRERLSANLGLRANRIAWSLGDIVLDAGNSLTLRWVVMPLTADEGYFGFINRVRERWNSNYTVQGPFNWISVTDPMLEHPERLRAYFDRKQVRLLALSPWLDYDPGAEDHVWPREEYKQRVQRAVRVIKGVNREIKCIGCIETDWVTIYPEQIPGGEQLPVATGGATGVVALTEQQTRIIDEANLPWHDSLKRDPSGALKLELYTRGGKPQTALSVYPAQGNYQYEFLLGQVKFLLDDVGLDGYYIDEFNQSWTDIRTYQGWDGVSAEVDPLTGGLGRRYVDCGLVGSGARVELARYALDRGKVVVANTYATSMSERRLPVNRFAETQWAFDPMLTEDGAKPQLNEYLLWSGLGSPIGLGIVGDPAKQDTARRLMKAIVTYLRHGMVYYHYMLEDIPESGPGSGEYGPVNHMFPITPVRLGEGFVEGKERVVTCISGTWQRPAGAEPTVLVFDLTGRPATARNSVERTADGWSVQLGITDWAQVAVIK